ncbi:DUF4386 domain-containing protein [Paenibacillus sp. IB182363]|uniref:DUF4386 domain-containing protein n=1 Tax=Paenibacillus oceani TaxID=2772510 RepID=A0A927C624_9BACL|nr:DUF4386 domain-containing protein [Paenibacillus oceani]
MKLIKPTHYQNLQHTSAIVAGVSLFIMSIAAAFSYGYVHTSLIVNDDALMTLTNIQQSGSRFAFGILGWLVIILTDLLVSWAFYVYLKPIHHEYSLLAGWLRLIYTAILAIAVSHLVVAGRIARAGTSPFNESINGMASQSMLSIKAFESIWSLGLILFGLHLLAIGFIALSSRHIPKYVSIMIAIAGFSYVIVHVMDNFFPQLEPIASSLETLLSIPMIIGELGFGIWLLIKGRKLSLSTDKQP